jgi:hypothetical protein
MKRIAIVALAAVAAAFATQPASVEYRVLATSKTSTMEKEMNEAAQAGFVFGGVMGGETAFGGKEVLVVMTRSGENAPRIYKLIAANRTSTLEKELQAAGEEGFEYRGQTVFESAFGGREVALILERDKSAQAKRSLYKLLATSKTSTMQKELSEIGAEGFQMLGMTVGKTAFGGAEVVCILSKSFE